MTFSVASVPAVATRVLLFLFLAAIARSQSKDETPKQTFQRVCIDCHGMEMVDGQHYSRDVWQETVEQMVRRGAQASDEDVQTIVDYLAATYPPTKIHINAESASDLQLDLPLTSKVASAIVHYRQEHGDFKSIDDLAKVPDLDPAIIKENKDRFVF
jgi:competence protein ComEA